MKKAKENNELTLLETAIDPYITRGHIELRIDKVRMSFTGFNNSGRRVIGSFLETNSKTRISRYLYKIITEEDYALFTKGQISYKGLLNKEGQLFLIFKKYDEYDNDCSYIPIEKLSVIPKKMLPAKDSYIINEEEELTLREVLINLFAFGINMTRWQVGDGALSPTRYDCIVDYYLKTFYIDFAENDVKYEINKLIEDDFIFKTQHVGSEMYYPTFSGISLKCFRDIRILSDSHVSYAEACDLWRARGQNLDKMLSKNWRSYGACFTGTDSGPGWFVCLPERCSVKCYSCVAYDKCCKECNKKCEESKERDSYNSKLFERLRDRDT